MTKRAPKRVGSWLAVSFTLGLAGACAMEGEEGMVAGDEPGMEEAGEEAGGDPTGMDEAIPDGSETTGELEQSVIGQTNIDFENYAVGAVPAPWSVTRNMSNPQSSASIERTGDHGKALLIQGSPVAGQYVIASLGTSISSDFQVSADIEPDASGAVEVQLVGQGSSNYLRRIRLAREPGSGRLVAKSSPAGTRVCGTLPAGRWTEVTFDVHPGSDGTRFDILLDGRQTACADIETVVKAPFTSLRIEDSVTSGSGGALRFDNIAIAVR